jgi:hypothetical protein
LHSLPDINITAIKSRCSHEMGGGGEMRYEYKILVGKSEEEITWENKE